MKRFTRSKRKFRSARSAWADIASKTGKTARDVQRKAHTRSHWVFVVK